MLCDVSLRGFYLQAQDKHDRLIDLIEKEAANLNQSIQDLQDRHRYTILN